MVPHPRRRDAVLRLTVFALEYDPRFLASWHPERPPDHAGITRAAVLERYAAALERSALHATAPFADVSEVQLALADAERERLLAVCAAASYEIETGVDTWTCFGPQFRLVLRRSAEPGGVTGFELALREPIVHEPLELGEIRLTFRGDTAAFALRP